MSWERPAWHDQAHCGRNGKLGDDPHVRVHAMFSLSTTSVCEGCPVRDQCEAAGRFAARSGPGMGVWGGKSIGGIARSCEVCGELFTAANRRATCSPTCKRERLRRREAERAREYRQRQFAGACCELCGRVRHAAACPNRPGREERRRALIAEFGAVAGDVA